MPYLAKLDTAEEDARLRQQRIGSQTMILGFVILGMGAVLSIFDFIDHREGTHLMLAVSSVLWIVGLVLVGLGEFRRAEPV